MQLNYLIIYLLMGTCLFADPPDWQDDPNGYQFTAVMNALILINDVSISSDGDILAAFDADGNVRGTSSLIDPGFGDYNGFLIHEIMLRSNTAGDFLYFKYYDASEEAVLDIVDTYEFVINDIVGDLTDPVFYNIAFVTLSFSNPTLSSVDITYESNVEIYGFQLNVEGVILTGATSAFDGGII